ncbi:SGNH/GDSL hydrolase family protein [Dactylosporangium sp. AC04546]|uniref:SGNH/GDSL hydrolase family protein n=1 Tax=Dactylosporangium sp. AC04546 TaxID=2862460 RepID=UPI001EDE03A8|nr:SGNH/GDSL hydrolase family protein [Dactylosporangium sp. AC04546]WVK86181.1 SGNH/GDSL hydrolase family protein [Dactylosporangium sp. AC04546]
MAPEYAQTLESLDPHCLRDGEAARLLARHRWRRFAVLGDSVAEGLTEPVDGYHPLAFPDRVRAELAAVRPELAYLNLGRRNLRVAEVHATQLSAALAFAPDLAMVICGANDAMRPGYEARADAVDAGLTAIVRPLQRTGTEVVTVSLFVMPAYPSLPSWLGPAFSRRMALLGRRLAALALELGTIHVDLANHPAIGDDDHLTGSDGLHGNGRSHAIAAAEVVRRLARAI